jgi:hypothetical protein
MHALVAPKVKKIGVKKNAESNPGRVLKFAAHNYLPISHPPMPNQVMEHLRLGFAALGLGRPMFDLKSS